PRAPWRADPPPPISFDIDACAQVRDAVGDAMALMLDASWSYSYAAALQVGSRIQELGFLWYEDRRPALDIRGYRRLKRRRGMPVMATDVTPGGREDLAQWGVSEA